MAVGAFDWRALLRRGPSELLSWTAIVLSFLAIAVVGGWNAANYKITLGYDYNSNAEYMHILLDEHRIPTPQESLESRQPPLYYLVGGLAARAGHWIFGWHEEPTKDLPEHSYRGAQILNTVFVLVTALFVLLLARTIAPRSPPMWAAAVAFFAFLPVVSKTEAMIHAEPMNMMLSTAAVWLTTKIVRRSELSRGLLLALILVLALGVATRASIVFTAAAIAIALAVRYAPYLDRSRVRRHSVPIAVACVLLAAVVYWVVDGHHSGTLVELLDIGHHLPGNRAAFFRLPLGEMFTTPFRSHYVNSAVGETYTEIWGDWIGSFAWSTFMGSPTGRILATLKNQSWIGLIPTLMALGGYGLLLWAALRKRRDLLAAALVPPIAIAGYLVRSYQGFSPDGDLLKATYILTTAPIWALSFGIAYDRLGRFRLLRIGLTATLIIFAVIELRFMLYGVRDGNPPF